MTSIFELSREIKEIGIDIKEKEEAHKELINALNSRRSELQNTLDNHLKGLDGDKMDRGASVVYIKGKAHSPCRKGVLQEAIQDLLNNSGKKMKERYFGVKNYDSFGDQECDCEYGMGPTYGSIVFEIGLHREYRNKTIDENLLEDAIYYLTNVSK
jgi:hypothetical protein